MAARAARTHSVLVAPLPPSPGSLPAKHTHIHTHTHDCPNYLHGGMGACLEEQRFNIGGGGERNEKGKRKGKQEKNDRKDICCSMRKKGM